MQLTKEDKKNIKTLFDLFYNDVEITTELKDKFKKEFRKTYNLFENELYTNYEIIGG